MSRHLIHIGFPKAGSTALQAWFDLHPGFVHVSNGLAGHSSGKHLARHAASGGDLDRWYVTSSERLSIPRRHDDGTDDPSDGPVAQRRRRACELLRDLFGGATILIVTRGFHAVLASGYSQYVRTGGTSGPGALLSQWATVTVQTGLAVEDYFDYDATVALYRATFGDEHVVVLPYELLRDDPHAFLSGLEERLGLAASGLIPPRVNAALSGSELFWYPRLSRLAAAAAAPLGAPGARGLALYHARIGSPELRRGVTLLARLAPRAVDPTAAVPDELVERCRGRAAALAALPAYAPYAAEYLNDAR